MAAGLNVPPAGLALPQLYAELVPAVGITPALALAEWRGGVPLYIPHDIPSGHEIEQRLGADAARWLEANWGGSYLRVPKASAYLRHLRDQELIAQRHHYSLAELALRYRLDVRWVSRILERAGVRHQPASQGQLW